ncbi:MAG: matrixin family metalloprotease [Balneola sp.]
MKLLLIIFLFGCISLSLTAQSVVFKADRVIYDDIPLLLNGVVGKWTNSQYVTFYNQTNSSVNVNAHLHKHLDFIFFVNDDNLLLHEISIDIPAFSTHLQRVTAKASVLEPVLFNDQLGFDIKYQNNKKTYFELTASAYFYKDRVGTIAKPDGYYFWGLDGYPRILESTDLPIKLYSNHQYFGVHDNWDNIVRKAVNTWNNAGRSIGIKANFYVLTDIPSDADFTIDWSGEDLPPTALGAASLTNSNPSYIRGIVMLPPDAENSLQTAEVLIQEMGHILGLDHSEHPSDIMNGQAHPLHHDDLSQIKLTTRDRQMLSWLYSQSNYVPIVSGRNYPSKEPDNNGVILGEKEHEQHDGDATEIEIIADIKSKSRLIRILINELEHAVIEHKLSVIVKESDKIQQICSEINNFVQALKSSEKKAVLNFVLKTNKAAHELAHSANEGHVKVKQLNHDYEHLKEIFAQLNSTINTLN